MRLCIAFMLAGIASTATAQDQSGDAEFTSMGIIRPSYEWIRARPEDRNVAVLLNGLTGEILTCGLQSGYCDRIKLPRGQ